MPNTTVRAAAEGMPAINRRRLLLGLAAASTAAATVTATIATAATISENPELLWLGGLLPALETEYHAAAVVRSAIVKKWSKRWPSAPTALHDWNGREVERDLTGFGVLETNEYGEEPCRHILTTEYLEWHTKRARSILKGRGIDKRNRRGGEGTGAGDVGQASQASCPLACHPGNPRVGAGSCRLDHAGCGRGGAVVTALVAHPVVAIGLRLGARRAQEGEAAVTLTIIPLALRRLFLGNTPTDGSVASLDATKARCGSQL